MSRVFTIGRAASVRGLSRAPYRDQVLVHLIGLGVDDNCKLSAAEEAKVARCARFLPASQCAQEIADQRGFK